MFGYFGIDANAVFRKRIGCLLILFLMMTSSLYAANPYKLGGVDYFNSKSPVQSSPEEKEEEDFDWRDPSVSDDGKTTYYIPPGPMLTLLKDPTLENAKVYVNWQKNKVERIMKAQEVIEQAIKEGNKK